MQTLLRFLFVVAVATAGCASVATASSCSLPGPYPDTDLEEWAAPTTVTTVVTNGPDPPAVYALGRLNADAAADFVYATSTSGSIVVLFNQAPGDGTNWGGSATIGSLTAIPLRAQILDLDGDGDNDIVVHSIAEILAFTNNGAGTFSTANSIGFAPLTTSSYVEFADMDADGILDIVIGSITGRAIKWGHGTGPLTFAPLANITEFDSNSLADMTVVDVLNDTLPDVMYTLQGNGVYYTENGPNGTLFDDTDFLLKSPSTRGPMLITDMSGNNNERIDALFLSLTESELVWFDELIPTLLIGHQYLRSVTSPNSYIFAVDDFFGDAGKEIVCAREQGELYMYEIWGDFGIGRAKTIYDGTDIDRVGSGDVTGDGRPDVIFIEKGTGSLMVAHNEPDPQPITFTPSIALVNYSPYTVSHTALADLDGDGHPDIIDIAADYFVFRTLMNSDGSRFTPFEFPNSLSAPASALSSPTAVAAADFDMDGDNDIVVSESGRSRILILDNIDGRGTFDSSRVAVSGLAAPSDVVPADMDGDGDVDLVVSSSAAAGSLSWFANDGTGAFSQTPVVIASVGSPVFDIDVIDASGSGTPDVVYATADAVGVIVSTDGTGTSWTPTSAVTVGSSGTWTRFHCADLDMDGAVDVAYVHSGGNMGYLRNSGGALDPSPVLVVNLPYAPNNLGIVDVNMDGAPDLAVASSATNIVWYPNGGAGTFGSQQPMATLTGTASQVRATGPWGRLGDSDGIFVNDGKGYMMQPLTLTAFARDDPRTLSNAGPAFAAARNSSASACYRFGPNGGYTMACVMEQSMRVSGYVRETLLMEPAVYKVCPKDAHYTLQRGIELKAATPGSVVFDCSDNAGVLFDISESYLIVQLNGIVVEGMGSSLATSGSSPGIRVDSSLSDLVLINSTVTQCSTVPQDGVIVAYDGGGGAVLVVKGDVYLRDSILSDNTAGAGSGGGALSIVGQFSEGCMDGASVVTRNTAQAGSGGGIQVSLSGELDIRGSAFVSGNTADRDGGGMYVAAGGIIRLYDDTHSDGNVAGRSGGGIAVGGSGKMYVYNDVKVTGNSAAIMGGGVAVSTSATLSLGSTLTGSTVTIASNVAGRVGGGVGLASPASVTLRTAHITGNTAGVGGGLASVSVESVPQYTTVDTLTDLPRTGDVGAASQVVDLDECVVSGNTGLLYASSLLVCDGAIVELKGADTVIGVDGTVLCLPLAGDTSVPLDANDRTGIPWLEFDDDAWGVLGGGAMPMSTPPVSLQWVDAVEGTVVPGLELEGSVRLVDWFGNAVVDPRLLLTVQLVDPLTEGVALVGTPEALMGASPTLLPKVSVRVAASSMLPVPEIGLEFLPQSQTGRAISNVALIIRQVLPLGVCPAGYGGVDDAEAGTFECVACLGETFSTAVSIAPCNVCPTNAAIKARSNTTADGTPVGDGRGSLVNDLGCVCVPGTYALTLDPLVCLSCPDGGVCAGGEADPTAAPGYYPSESRDLFLVCPNPQACAGAGTCAEGYSSRLCAECSEDYYALNGKCLACDKLRDALVLIAMLVFVTAVIVVLFGFNLAESMSYKFAAAMIGLNGLQISAIYGRLEFDWGPFADVYFDVASVLNLNFELTSPECSALPGTDVWVLKYLLTLILPLLAAVSVGIILCGYIGASTMGLKWVRDKNTAQMIDAAKRTWYQLMVLLYMPLCAGSFSLFGCRKDAAGRWVLAAAPSRTCYTSTWWGLFVPGLLGVVLYAFGLPGAVVYVLRREQRQMDMMTFVLRYGFLVGRFRDEGWWYEAGIMGRKLGVVICMTFFWADESKAYGAVVVLMGCLVHLLLFNPYTAKLHNIVAAVVLCAVLGTLQAGTVENKHLRTMGVVIGIVVNVGAIIVGNVLDILRMRSEEDETEDVFKDSVVETDIVMTDGLGTRDDLEMRDMGSVRSDVLNSTGSQQAFSMSQAPASSTHAMSSPAMAVLESSGMDSFRVSGVGP